MAHLLRLDSLRESMWSIINEGIERGVDLSIVSPGCGLHSEGYARLYTPDVELWAFIHAAADVDSAKLTAWTGHTVTTADLKKLIKDALCSDNYFAINPAELAKGTHRLPRLAHYDRVIDMNNVVQWLTRISDPSSVGSTTPFGRPGMARTRIKTPSPIPVDDCPEHFASGKPLPGLPLS